MRDYVPTFSTRLESRSVKAYVCSALMHVAFILLSVRGSALLLHAFPPEVKLRDPIQESDRVIHYDLKSLRLAEGLPSMAPAGSGGRPGQGEIPSVMPRLGNSAADPQTTIVVRLPKPDATHQLIHQPAVPPNVRIKADLRLPNIITQLPKVVEKPIAPAETQVMVIRRGSGRDLSTSAKPVEAPIIRVKQPTVKVPSLPVDTATPVLAEQQSEIPVDPKPSGMGKEPTGEPAGLVVLTANPGAAGDIVALPNGNSDGSFSVGQGPLGAGSPGGSPNGAIGGGTGGSGEGGDGSTGKGSGNSGGGGSGDGLVMIASSRGPSGAGLRALNPRSLAIFPVVLPPRTRKASLTISAGPIGGGGLDVYGVLKGARVYTVYLPIPKKNWVLQYCASIGTAASGPQVQQHGNVVQFQTSVESPEPVEQFDFKRIPVPVEKRGRYVILRGTIDSNGKPIDLSIYRGVEPELDELALQAFGKWKFSPALKAGAAVAVDILVGIPAVE
jgi:TonB family protein